MDHRAFRRPYCSILTRSWLDRLTQPINNASLLWVRDLIEHLDRIRTRLPLAEEVLQGDGGRCRLRRQHRASGPRTMTMTVLTITTLPKRRCSPTSSRPRRFRPAYSLSIPRIRLHRFCSGTQALGLSVVIAEALQVPRRSFGDSQSDLDDCSEV